MLRLYLGFEKENFASDVEFLCGVCFENLRIGV